MLSLRDLFNHGFNVIWIKEIFYAINIITYCLIDETFQCEKFFLGFIDRKNDFYFFIFSNLLEIFADG